MHDNPLHFLDTYRLRYFTFYFKKNILAEKSFSLKYIFYRIARPILKLNYKLFKLFHPESPWLSQTAILFFEQYLTKEMVGFEYGSGFSTLFYSKKVKHIVAVEHHKEWYDLIQKKLTERQANNVEYVFMPTDKNTVGQKLPDFYKKNNLSINDFSYRKEYYSYFEYIKQYEDAFFDFIIIDGRARVECTFNAISKLKSGGLLILDNSERKRYAPVFELLKNWEQSNTSNGLTDTTFWVKP